MRLLEGTRAFWLLHDCICAVCSSTHLCGCMHACISQQRSEGRDDHARVLLVDQNIGEVTGSRDFSHSFKSEISYLTRAFVIILLAYIAHLT